MAETKRQKSKIHLIINEHCIPEQGVAGDFWIAKAEQTVWYTTNSGIVVNLSDVLSTVPSEFAVLKTEVASLRQTVQALLDMTKKSSEYIAWLGERTAKGLRVEKK